MMMGTGLSVILSFGTICAVVGGIASLWKKDWTPFWIAAAIAILFTIVVSFASG